MNIIVRVWIPEGWEDENAFKFQASLFDVPCNGRGRQTLASAHQYWIGITPEGGGILKMETDSGWIAAYLGAGIMYFDQKAKLLKIIVDEFIWINNLIGKKCRNTLKVVLTEINSASKVTRCMRRRLRYAKARLTIMQLGNKKLSI